MKVLRYLTAAAAALLLLPAVHARDLGTIGPVYPISEPDMLVQIQDVLRAKEASGELAKLQRQARDRIVRQVSTPAPVAGLRRAQVPRSFHFDPSVRFEEPIVDHEGRVIVAAGTAANPLSVVSFRETWLFFDARDARQVNFVQAQLATATQPIKPILVGGSPMELMRQWKRPVYFDQGGRITTRLGVQAVPSRVRQDGELLLIEEIPAP